MHPELLSAIERRISRHFRSKRMAAFAERFGLTSEAHVLDVGGTPMNWLLLPEQQRPHVTLINVPPATRYVLPERMTYIQGDGCALPFPDRSFDVVFSNSVIEHVGGWDNQQRMALEVRRVARRYYVQTPDVRFPIEPHFKAPFVHWLPMAVRPPVIRYATLWGLVVRPSSERVRERLVEIRLLTFHEMRRLFPDASVERERVAGWPKSLIAVH